jgi:hypothetical protein
MERSPRITHLAWDEIEADGLARGEAVGGLFHSTC